MVHLTRAFFVTCVLAVSSAPRAQDWLVMPCQRVHVGSELFADLDGDLIPDWIGPAEVLLPADPAPGFALGHGRGNGTFHPPAVFTGASGRCVTGDIDGDGVLDVAMLEGEDDSAHPALAAFTNLGGSSFGPPLITILQSVGSTDGVPVLVDLDGDGRVDLLTGLLHDVQPFFSSHDVIAVPNIGGGAFGPEVFTPKGSRSDAIADFDLDGDLDLIDHDAAANALVTMTGTGQGMVFVTGPASAAPEIPFDYITATDAGDFDQDGAADLVVTGEGGSTEGTARVLRYRGNGDGTFTFAQILDVTVNGRLCVGDLDEDARPDVVIAHGGYATPPFSGSTASILIINALGAWNPETRVLIRAQGYESKPQIIDIDADGHADIAISDRFVLGHGDGTFTARNEIPIGEKAVRIAAADLNGDGHLDLLGTLDPQTGTQTLAGSFGDGDGSFGPASLVDLGGKADDMALGDLDGDALPDLVLASDGSLVGPLNVWNGVGGLSFSGPLTLGSFKTSDVQLGDVDGNGALDIVLADPTSKDLALFLGDGSGSFTPASIGVGFKTRHLALRDLDQDGNIDVVAASQLEQALYVLLGSGSGGFATPQSIALDSKPLGLVADDLDENGAADLATLEVSNLSILLASGPAAFAPAVTVPLPLALMLGKHHDFEVADLDHDGRKDLLFTIAADVMHVAGLGDGAFAPPTAIAGGDEPFDLTCSDLDEDGLPDLAAALRQGRAFDVLLNMSGPFPNLGFQHTSELPSPHLAATGLPLPGAGVRLWVTNVASGAAGWLVLGLGFTPQPFAGGTLVPSPSVILPTLADVPLTGRWPELPAGTTVFAQAWFSSDGEVTATNAIVGFTQ